MIATKARRRACVVVGLLASAVSAVNIETVPVGNPGNLGELSGDGAGGTGPDRICGTVDYAYNIGKYEVTAGQYTEFLNAVAKTDTYDLYRTNMWSSKFGCKIQRSGTSGSYTYAVAPDCANRPVNYVSWGDAARFVNWLHNGQPTGVQGLSTTEDGAYYLNGAIYSADLLAVNRKSNWKWAITSEDEWYKAAYHKNDGVTGNYFNYATGSDAGPGRDLNDASGNNANYYGTPWPIQSPHYTTVVGEFQNSDSPCGTFDQTGNVWEWTEAVIGSSRVVRGASFNENFSYLPASIRISYAPTDDSHTWGFRVVQVPEPTTLLLAIGSLAAIRRRRR